MCSYMAILLWNVLGRETLISILILQRAIEIREIISDVNKKDTPRFAGKISCFDRSIAIINYI